MVDAIAADVVAVVPTVAAATEAAAASIVAVVIVVIANITDMDITATITVRAVPSSSAKC